MRERDEHSLSPWVIDALRNPAPGSTTRSASRLAAQRSAIMDRVRREPAPHVLSTPMRASRWTRRGLLTPFGGMTLVALFFAAISLRGLDERHGSVALETASLILGDSVVPVHEGSVRADTLGERFLDTLRVVEFVLRGPSVRSATIVGDFNSWERGATALTRESDDTWRARVLVPRDALHFAYVVNDARIVTAAPLHPAPSSSRSIPDSI